MFECYSLIDPMKLGAISSQGSCLRRQLQNPIIAFLSLCILVFWKNDFIDNVKNCKILSEKHEEF
jgi:hypothetical protein